MWEEDQSLAFYKKTPNLCKMHKNRQNSVDSLSDICFDVGMDARRLKKEILYAALERYNQHLLRLNEKFQGSADREIEVVMDTQNLSQAKRFRFYEVLNKMIDDAFSKL